MVIIITGASHTGKTYLSNRLIKELKYSAISMDSIKMGLIRSGQTDLTVEDDIKLTSYLWPIFSNTIKTIIENKQNAIIEGCYVPFNFMDDFDDFYKLDIKFVCLGFSKNYIENNFDKIKEYSCIVENRLDEKYLTIDYLNKENDYYVNGFKSINSFVYLIDKDYKKEINLLIKQIKKM